MITTDTHVYFYGSLFSNWYSEIGLIVDPITNLPFDNTEQAFMWYKATFFGDAVIAAEAAKQTDPREVKALGRRVRGYNDRAWECVRYGYMVYVNYLKYSQNVEHGKTLRDTGDRILVEASPYDKVWGVGLATRDPLILDCANWQGRNLLGEALMTVRGLILTNQTLIKPQP